MSSASESPEGHERATPSRDERERPASGDLPLLDQILQQTLRNPDQPRPQVADELAALVEIAKRYPDQAFTLQPILEEMVDALLGPQLANLSLPPAARQGMVTELARTLYDDTASRERLEALMEQLAREKAMSASANAPHELIAQCQGLVRSIAWKIHRGLPSSIEIDDLLGYGQVGLAEAARDFDPTRTGAFTTYAYYRIRGAIYDGLSKMSWFSRAQYARLRYAQRANDLLASENENTALADRPVDEDVRWFRDVVGSLAVSYLTSASRDDEERSEISLVDSGPLPPGVLMGEEARRIVNELIAALPEQESQLIRAAYFEGLTLQEAGQRLGISKAWASRLHARSLQRLGRSLKRLELVD